jgi:UDP-2-acetamido-3-amino-2,3-dideoxy-glucuronate N-acetyltransferase
MIADQTSPQAQVHETAVVDKGAIIGPETRIWHFSHISSGARIGSGCSLGQNVFVAGEATIGDNCKIQNNVSLYDGVVLEDEVFCGPSCVFTNDFYPRAHAEQGWSILPTLVKKGASIGANATIVCGNTIGEYAMVAAGAVVASDVTAHALVVGVPAKQVGWVCTCGRKLAEQPDKSYFCPTCAKRFEFQANYNEK